MEREKNWQNIIPALSATIFVKQLSSYTFLFHHSLQSPDKITPKHNAKTRITKKKASHPLETEPVVHACHSEVGRKFALIHRTSEASTR